MSNPWVITMVGGIVTSIIGGVMTKIVARRKSLLLMLFFCIGVLCIGMLTGYLISIYARPFVDREFRSFWQPFLRDPTTIVVGRPLPREPQLSSLSKPTFVLPKLSISSFLVLSESVLIHNFKAKLQVEKMTL